MRSGPFRQQNSFEGTVGSSSQSSAFGDNSFPLFGNEIESPTPEKSTLAPPASKQKSSSPTNEFNSAASSSLEKKNVPVSDKASAAPPSTSTDNLKQDAGPADAAQVDETTEVESAVSQDANSAGKKEAVTLGVDGQPLTKQATETAQTSAPVRPPVPVNDSFDISNINPWWFATIPVVLLLGWMFRFLMGTSSSHDLVRYTYRGPKVEDRDDPNVRGRFKKRPRVSSEAEDEIYQAADNVEASEAGEEDDLGFLDDMPEPDSAVEIPAPFLMAANTPPSITTQQPLSNDESAATGFAAADDLVVSDSSESNPVKPTDSDDDFDFFADEDADLGAPSESVGETVGHDELAEPVAATEDSAAFDLTQPEIGDAAAQANDSDSEMDFFDDSDDGFSLDDEEVETPAVAAVSAESELVDQADDYQDEDVDAELIDADVEDESFEPAVAAAAVAGAAGVAAAKSGSWFSRLFKGRKAKKAKVVESDEDEFVESDSIAAVAVEDEDDVEVAAVGVDTEADFETDEVVQGSAFDEADAGDEVFADVSVVDSSVGDSGELSFSDSGDSFSLDDNDESSADLFDDDSDAGYEFEPSEEPEPIVAVAEDAPADPVIGIAETDQDDDDFDAMWSDDDEELELGQSSDEQSSSTADDSIAIFEEPETLSETLAFDGATDGSSDEAGDVDGGDSVAGPVASEETDSEFESVPMPIGHDELPLLEDQLLDDIVDAEQRLETEEDSENTALPGVAAGLAAGAIAAVASSELSSDGADAGQDLSEANADQLAALQARIAELESSNASLESQQAALKEELLTEQQAKQQAQTDAESAAEKIVITEEAAVQAIADAEKAAADLESAVEEAKADAAAAREQAEVALAAKAELEASAEQRKEEAFGGSLMAAAGGALAGGAVASAASDGDAKASDTDDPFRLEPEQVKVMLKKLKTERKKRLKTKEYFLAADAKRREVAATLQKVTGELQSLKVEFSQLADGASGDVSADLVAELKRKLDSAEDALKKK